MNHIHIRTHSHHNSTQTSVQLFSSMKRHNAAGDMCAQCLAACSHITVLTPWLFLQMPKSCLKSGKSSAKSSRGGKGIITMAEMRERAKTPKVWRKEIEYVCAVGMALSVGKGVESIYVEIRHRSLLPFKRRNRARARSYQQPRS